MCKRCSIKCPKSKLQCILNEGHSGNHKYTPDHLLSPSTITKILLELTSGEITSLAGLDNIDVQKGHDNFENMRTLVDTLTNIIGGDNATETCKKLQTDIDEVQNFHKVNFTRHLGQGTSQCACLHCGFFHSEKDPIQCKCCNSHKPPCIDCQKSFQVSPVVY